MQNPKRNRLDRQLRNLRCPSCQSLLARMDQGGSSVLEIRCRRCKATVLVNPDGITYAEQDLTQVAH